MPELPEVETVRAQLNAQLAGATLHAVQIFRTGREFPPGEEFISRIKGLTLNAVKRRAKLLIFEFSDGVFVTAHLKMTGKFVFVSTNSVQQKHDRILFVFGSNLNLIWSDIRQFGYLKVVSGEELKSILAKYGPEPLETPLDQLADRLTAPKTRKVKAALLDQSTIAGVGNIYADEACFRAGIRPTRRLGTLTADDRRRLAEEIVNVLKESIAQKGTSANDYVDTNGERGGFLSLLKVYGREDLPCKQCELPIKKIVLGGRGTHYCATCQR